MKKLLIIHFCLFVTAVSFMEAKASGFQYGVNLGLGVNATYFAGGGEQAHAGFYSEQYGLAMYLLANSEKYQPLFANYYVSENMQLASIIADFWKHENTKNVERHGGSFWLKIN